MISARAETQFAHAYLPRDLHKYFRTAGLTLTDLQTFSIVETRYDPNCTEPALSESPVTRRSSMACRLQMLPPGNRISARVRGKVNGSFAWIVLCLQV